MAPNNRGGGMTGLLYITCYALLLAGIGYYYFNDANNVRLPRPRNRYYFDSNETQLVLAEAHKAAAQQQRLITAANAVLLALQASASQSQSNASQHVPEASAAKTANTVLVRDNADLWKLALASSLNMSDLSFPIDDAGTRARLSDYHVRALTAYNVALRTTTEEEADLAEMIDYVQLFNKLWRTLAADAFHEEGGLAYTSQAQLDLEWFSELAEEVMKPSARLQEEEDRVARRRAREARAKASTTPAGGAEVLTLNLRLLNWLRTHAATDAQAADIRRFVITQSRLWARRERIRGQQRADYAAQGGSRTAPSPEAPSPSSSSTSGHVKAEAAEMDEDTRLDALLSLSDDEWRTREAAVKVGVHVMLAADNGTYSGLHELHFIHAAMRFTTALDLGPDCQSATFGLLERPRRDPLTLRVLDPAKDAHAIQYVPVLAVTTGIYVSRAAVCTAAVASLPMFTVKSMTFMGTAGVSPVVELGGWSPKATTAQLYASDRSLHVNHSRRTTRAQRKALQKKHSDEQAAQASEWSASTMTETDADGIAWTRAELEAATNPECQETWNLNPGSTNEAGNMFSVSPLFRHAPSVRRARELTTRKVSIGSVCVTAAALLQECGVCVEENPRPSLCSRPQCSIHTSTTFFGPCDFAQRAGTRVGRGYAEHLKGAMFFQDFPPIPQAVQAGMRQFWASQEAIAEYERVSTDKVAATHKKTGQQAAEDAQADPGKVSYRYNRAPPDSPIVLNCAEVDTSQILAGIRSDVLCREYARALLFPVDAAPSPHLVHELREMEAKLPLTCVQAMEGLGFLTVMTRQYPDVPVAIVRGASNYDSYPLTRETYTEMEDTQDTTQSRASEPFFQTRQSKRRSLLKNVSAPGTSAPARQTLVRWVQNEHFMAPREYDAYVRASYRYAIETTSAVVLNFFLKENTILPGEERA